MSSRAAQCLSHQELLERIVHKGAFAQVLVTR